MKKIKNILLTTVVVIGLSFGGFGIFGGFGNVKANSALPYYWVNGGDVYPLYDCGDQYVGESGSVCVSMGVAALDDPFLEKKMYAGSDNVAMHVKTKELPNIMNGTTLYAYFMDDWYSGWLKNPKYLGNVSGKVSVTGKAKVNKKVKVKVKHVSPSGTKVKYTWKVKGKKKVISKKKSYKIPAKYKGKKLVVTVKITKSNYHTLTVKKTTKTIK